MNNQTKPDSQKSGGDECGAIHTGHKFGPNGPRGSRQCEYCGEPDSAAPGGDVEHQYEVLLRDEETLLPVSEALPCPFCGHQPVIQPWHGGGPSKRRIRCPAEHYDQCAVSPSVTGSTRRQALERWNRRFGHE